MNVLRLVAELAVSLFLILIVGAGFAFFTMSVRAVWKAKRVRKRVKDAPMQPGEKAPEWFIASLMKQLADEAEHVVVLPSPHAVRARRRQRIAERTK